MNKSDIIEKIKKLLEINRANGATEAEEIAALERANVLMTKYQIEKFQIKGSIKTKNVHQKEELTDKSLMFGYFRASVADFFGVLALNSKFTYSYYGDSEQVNLAIDMVKRAQTSESLGFTNYLCSNEYRANRRRANRRIIKNSFHDGFFFRLGERLDEFVEQRKEETAKATGANLVVLEKDNLERSYSDDFGYKLRTSKTGRVRDVDQEAFTHGKQKGEEFSVLEELKHEKNGLL